VSDVITNCSRHELRVPIGDGLSTAVTVVSPERPDGTVVFALPGGGYNRSYYDLTISGYSQAEWHASRGWTVVCCDHLGVGASDRPDPETLTFEVLAEANDATATAVLEGLQLSGPVLGLGQSMGGCLLIHQQARHRSFDAIAVLGFSAIHTVLPMPSGGFDMPTGLSLEDAAAQLTETLLSYAFHFPDEPREIVDEDVDGFPLRTEGKVPAWASATVPPAAVTMLTPGVVTAEAASVDVPVLVVAGEIDVNTDLDAERAMYCSSPSVETMRLERSAHMHNFAHTRELLWRRIHTWGNNIGAKRLSVDGIAG
jgi:pimeloyl-ACP methyl ester carboxylesterase